MKRIVALTRERKSENWSQTDYFIIEPTVINAEKNMRQAIADYLKTEDGKRMIDYSAGDYNWGDALASVTDKYWNKYGVEIKYDDKAYTVSGETIEIKVNQDEVLCEDIFEEE